MLFELTMKKISKHLLFLIFLVSAVTLLEGCRTSEDPRKAGFFGGMSNLSSGVYEKRLEEKKQSLQGLEALEDRLAARMQDIDRERMEFLNEAQQIDVFLNDVYYQLQESIEIVRLEAEQEGTGGEEVEAMEWALENLREQMTDKLSDSQEDIRPPPPQPAEEVAGSGSGQAETGPVDMSSYPGRLPDVTPEKVPVTIDKNSFLDSLAIWSQNSANTDYNKANVMYDQGRYQRAAYYYKRAIKTKEFGPAFFNLGLSEAAQGRENDSIEAFGKACDMDVQQACQLAT